jgi:hypothetical protein
MSFHGKIRPSAVNTRHHLSSIAAAVLFVMLAAQAISTAHFLLIPHTIDRRTGKTVRLRTHAPQENPGQADHESSDRHAPGRSGDSDECPINALLNQSKLPDLHGRTVVPDAVFARELPTVLPETFTFVSRRIYLVSPAHSPPAA